MIRSRMLPVIDAALEPALRFASVEWTGTSIGYFIARHGAPDWRDWLHVDALGSRDALASLPPDAPVDDVDVAHVQAILSGVREASSIATKLADEGYVMAVPPAPPQLIDALREAMRREERVHRDTWIGQPRLVRWKVEQPPNPASSLHVVLALAVRDLEQLVARTDALRTILESV